MNAYIRTRVLISDSSYKCALLVVAVVGLIAALSYVPLPSAIDWDQTFRPAVIAWLSGNSPYAGEHPLYNPPWLLPMLAPFAVLPYALGRVLLLFASLGTFAAVARRFGASPIAMALFIFAVPTWDSLTLANIEWLVALGLIVPRPFGMVLLALKPQMSVCVAVFYAVESWRAGGFRGLVRLVLPLAIVAALSLVMFGLWPLHTAGYLQFQSAEMNYSFFPYLLPVGLVLLIQAIRKRDIRYALPCSPMFFPVVTPMSWSFAILPIVGMPLELAAVMVSTWIIALTNGRPI